MRGDTEVINLTIRDSAGNPVNLTGSTFASQIRYEKDATSIAANFDCVVTNPTGGVVQLTLTPVSSAALNDGIAYWDLQRTSGGVVSTLVAGKVTILADVTRL